MGTENEKTGKIRKIIDFLLGRQEPEEESGEITASFIKYVRSERVYKLWASCSFFILVFLIGVPMWHLTTTPYRAKFPIFPANRTISVPIRVNFAISSEKMEPEVLKLMEELKTNISMREVVAPLSFPVETRFLGVLEPKGVEQKPENSNFFEIYISFIPESAWIHYSATKVLLGTKNWIFVQFPPKKPEIVTDLVWETLIDVPHLNSIVRRDSRQRMQPWQIAALPLSHQKRLVWDSAPLATSYHIQVIHLHDNSAQPISPDFSKTTKVLRKFAEKVGGVTEVHVSSEHLWDFGAELQLLTKDVQERNTLTHENMEELVKKVDSQVQTTLEHGAVLRFVVLETAEPVIILDSTGEDTKGVAVASWGGVLSRNEHTEKQAVAVARIHLGMDAELAPGWHRPPAAVCQWEIARARLRASVDNAMRAASAIRALERLTHKISNIVIDDSVARRATQAVQILEDVVGGESSPKLLNFERLLEARRLADAANADHSLLAMLYFPMDQRTAVLIPLAVPIVLPICKLVYEIAKITAFWSFL